MNHVVQHRFALARATPVFGSGATIVRRRDGYAATRTALHNGTAIWCARRRSGPPWRRLRAEGAACFRPSVPKSCRSAPTGARPARPRLRVESARHAKFRNQGTAVGGAATPEPHRRAYIGRRWALFRPGRSSRNMPGASPPLRADRRRREHGAGDAGGRSRVFPDRRAGGAFPIRKERYYEPLGARGSFGRRPERSGPPEKKRLAEKGSK